MNEHTISLVRESFDLIEPIAPQAGEMFFANLFEADPSMQRLFGADTATRGDQLMQMIALAVAKLDQPAELMPTLQALGQRHAACGVREAHYDTAGAALLKTLYQSLGVAYNAEVEAAWIEAYALVARALKEGSSPASTTRLRPRSLAA